jgi:CheY-like chemotaxis protein
VSHSENVSAPGKSKTILLVDDEKLVRSLVRFALEAKGYRVFEASDGEEAIHIAELFADKIELLLTDVVLPQKDGKQVANEIKPLTLGRPRSVRIADLKRRALTAIPFKDASQSYRPRSARWPSGPARGGREDSLIPGHGNAISNEPWVHLFRLRSRKGPGSLQPEQERLRREFTSACRAEACWRLDRGNSFRHLRLTLLRGGGGL